MRQQLADDEGAMIPDYVCIGALTQDITPTGWLRGGTSWYACQAVARWGGSTAIVSPLGWFDIADGIPHAICRIPASTTATFANKYVGDTRQQYLYASTVPIDWTVIPPGWLKARIIHLAPVVHEIQLSRLRQLFPHALIGLTPQGLSRCWDATGKITTKGLNFSPEILQQLDVIVISNEDLEESQQRAEAWSRFGTLVAVTQGGAGVQLWRHGGMVQIAAYAAKVIDPTGAGDVWTAAFLWRLAAGVVAEAAAQWACAAAACAIEGIGIAGLPQIAEIEQRMQGVV